MVPANENHNTTIRQITRSGHIILAVNTDNGIKEIDIKIPEETGIKEIKNSKASKFCFGNGENN